MVKELEKAKKAIQSLWTGVCNIFEFKEITDKYGKTRHKLIKICENTPCRLSFKNINSAEQTEMQVKTSQVIKLFVAPEVYIPPGSIIEVTQNNITRKYKNSGISAIISINAFNEQGGTSVTPQYASPLPLTESVCQ